MTRLVLVRHGRTQWNSERRYIGITDQGLSEEGKKQAEWLAGFLKEVDFQAIYSSTLKRAEETAGFVGQACNVQPKTVSGLEEIDFGSWEGLTIDDIKRRDHSNLIDAWRDLKNDFQMPEGEKWSDFQERISNSFDEILANSDEKTIGVVAHAGPIKYALCYLLKIGPSNFWKFQVDHGSVTILEIEKGRAIITLLNRTPQPPAVNT